MLHWRLAIGIVSGAIGFAVASLCGANATFAGLIAWNSAVAVYLAVTWHLFLTASETEVRDRCGRRDEQRWAILAMIIFAVSASLAAIVGAMTEIKQLPHAWQPPAAGLAIMTLIGSWAMLQTVFALHYAHEHFLDIDRRGEGGGIAFPGEPARTYLDFVYLAVCVGATGQVSDPNVTTTRLRNLVTAHGVTAFFYNTAVLALGINILASLLSA
jgi:uncharacterized membrane protein